MGSPFSGYPSSDSKDAVPLKMQLLFDRRLRQGWWKQFIARVIGRCRQLLRFDPNGNFSSYDAGYQAIQLTCIRGSVNKADDFDIDFYPLHQCSEQRWSKIANLMKRGEMLPPVELLQVGDVYYVVDGHHRVSAARALGYRYIDAHVRVMPIEGCTCHAC